MVKNWAITLRRWGQEGGLLGVFNQLKGFDEELEGWKGRKSGTSSTRARASRLAKQKEKEEPQPRYPV